MQVKIYNRIRIGAFVKVHRLDRWIRGRFTPLGRILLGSLVAVGLFALNPRLTQAWLLAIVLLTVIMVALTQAVLFRPDFRIRRLLPGYATMGHDLHYQVVIENCSRRELPAVQLKEKPQRLRLKDLFEHTAENNPLWIIKRKVGYPRFVRLLRARDGFHGERGVCSGIAPGREQRLSMCLAPMRRGYLNLSRLCLERVDPLGIFRAWSEQSESDRLLVLPRRYPLRWRDSSGRHRRLGTGNAQSSATGGSVDFARLREYRQGDSMRHIHWRAWAHLGIPVVMEFHQQTPGRSALILDTFATEASDLDAFEEAVSVAASFCGDSRWCNGRLELLLLGEQPVRLGSSSQGLNRCHGIDGMLEALACVHPSPVHSPERLLHAARHELAGIEQCICVFLDYDEPRQRLLRELQLNDISLLVLVVHPEALMRVAQPGPLVSMTQQLLAIVPGQAAQVLADLPSTHRQRGSINHG